MENIIAALNSPARRLLYELVLKKERTVNQLAEAADCGVSAVSQHLKILLAADLVEVEQRGKSRIYRGTANGLDPLRHYLARLKEGAKTYASPPEDNLEITAARAAEYWPKLDRTSVIISFRIRQLAMISEASIKRQAQRFGLTPGEFFLLEALRREPPPHQSTPTLLKKAAFITFAGVGKQIARLEAAGYIESVANPEDGRASLVRLLPKGIDLEDEAVKHTFENPAYAALFRISEDEREALARILTRLQHYAEEGGRELTGAGKVVN